MARGKRGSSTKGKAWNPPRTRRQNQDPSNIPEADAPTFSHGTTSTDMLTDVRPSKQRLLDNPTWEKKKAPQPRKHPAPGPCILLVVPFPNNSFYRSHPAEATDDTAVTNPIPKKRVKSQAARLYPSPLLDDRASVEGVAQQASNTTEQHEYISHSQACPINTTAGTDTANVEDDGDHWQDDMEESDNEDDLYKIEEDELDDDDEGGYTDQEQAIVVEHDPLQKGPSRSHQNIATLKGEDFSEGEDGDVEDEGTDVNNAQQPKKALWQKKIDAETASVSVHSHLHSATLSQAPPTTNTWHTDTNLHLTATGRESAKLDIRLQSKLIRDVLRKAIAYGHRYLAFGVPDLHDSLNAATIQNMPTPMSHYGLDQYAYCALEEGSQHFVQLHSTEIIQRLQEEDPKIYRQPILDHLAHRLSLERGNIRKTIRQLVTVYYKHLDNPKILDVLMTRRGYIYQQKDDGSIDYRKLYQAPVLAPAIKAAFFDNDGVGKRYPNCFSSTLELAKDEHEVSPFMVALIMTMVEIRLHELQTGSNTIIELKGTTWVEPYRRHMDSLFEMLRSKPTLYHKLMHKLFIEVGGSKFASASLHDEVVADLDLEIMDVSD
ncbi:hypothetical protein PLEOSDRAFT_1106034 [Pleurotus ostreatus PC15]|uniref:DUF6532 domain-containing protein n=1 Tax=Pleurotus ostreatus (strain PC15) TaxID=1137138 RepID=A0A067NJG1_PLEO1|nr:hypothetical protein PLEOSDRAFT_1106034 [Pleurotus ostreatus PC15]